MAILILEAFIADRSDVVRKAGEASGSLRAEDEPAQFAPVIRQKGMASQGSILSYLSISELESDTSIHGALSRSKLGNSDSLLFLMRDKTSPIAIPPPAESPATENRVAFLAAAVASPVLCPAVPLRRSVTRVITPRMSLWETLACGGRG